MGSEGNVSYWCWLQLQRSAGRQARPAHHLRCHQTSTQIRGQTPPQLLPSLHPASEQLLTGHQSPQPKPCSSCCTSARTSCHSASACTHRQVNARVLT